ncbi:MAG: hypothetical protein ACRC6V_04540 [Bacteroidales bacterium]
MANFFEGVGNLLKHPIDEIKWMGEETKGVLKPLLKGDVSESWDSFKGSFGRHNDMMEDITVPLGGRNKLTENPDAAAGAVLGSIFAAPLAGALGSGGNSMFSLGDASKYLTPKQGVLGSSAFDFKGGIPGAGFQTDVGWKPGSTAGMDLMEDGGKYKPTTEFGGATDEGFDWDSLAQALQSIKGKPEKSIDFSGSGRKGFNAPPKSLYENPLLAREFQQMYSSPLYNKLV